MKDEYFDIIDESGNMIGEATRAECHGNKSLAHRVVHVLVFNSRGELYLQKRSLAKDIQRGKWDTSVGGHLNKGETFSQAVRREMKEELGISSSVEHIFDYWLRSPVETEYVRAYICTYDKTISPNPCEMDDGRFWSIREIQEKVGTGIFTPNFEQEYQRYLQYQKSR